MFALRVAPGGAPAIRFKLDVKHCTRFAAWDPAADPVRAPCDLSLALVPPGRPGRLARVSTLSWPSLKHSRADKLSMSSVGTRIDKVEIWNALAAMQDRAMTKEGLAAKLGKDAASVDAIVRELKKERLIFGSMKGGKVEYALTAKGLGFLIGATKMRKK
ncbi:MAG: hypothetical protein Q6373_018105 [Candidatus Sigynarchaeota archaeon]